MLNFHLNQHQTFEKNLALLNQKPYFPLIKSIKRGFEKETLRVDKNNRIAQTPHPLCLGSSLMHPSITTDFSEALLEFITPPSEKIEDPFQKLIEIHQAVYHCLKDEFLWASSIPCLLPSEKDIPIAQFGQSNLGQLRHLYRKGLGFRYGKIMQTIAGIHYNFSLSRDFFSKYHQDKRDNQDLKAFVSEQYLCLIRNFLRFGFMMPLLFGASPAASENFIHLRKSEFDFFEQTSKTTLIAPYATSLRLSDIGYHNASRTLHDISFNSFSDFLKTMNQALQTKDKVFAKIGVYVEGEYHQLNDTIFQIENEHYSLIRPKRIIKPDERTLNALTRDGIEYLEIRAFDINPYSLLGVDKEVIYFLDV